MLRVWEIRRSDKIFLCCLFNSRQIKRAFFSSQPHVDWLDFCPVRLLTLILITVK